MMIKYVILLIEMYEYFVEVLLLSECNELFCEVIFKLGLVKLKSIKEGMVFF